MRTTAPEPSWPLAVEQLPVSTLAQVRVGRLHRTGEGYDSAYLKQESLEPVQLSALGLDGDERTQEDHAGRDRAVLGYDPLHYETWASEVPERAGLFVPGSLGENLVVPGFNESTLCIGDAIAIGDVALIQVSQTRSPCFKINHHFDRPGLARITQTTGRCGWLARTLREGPLQAGDRVAVVDRPCPDWPLSRLLHHLYAAPFDEDIAQELAGLEPLAQSMREKFLRRISSRSIESFSRRLGEQTPA